MKRTTTKTKTTQKRYLGFNTVVIPKALHMKMKKFATKKGTTLVDITNSAITNWLKSN